MMNLKYLLKYSIFIFNKNIQYRKMYHIIVVSHQCKSENVLDQALKHIIT